jgi:hypothetical protein
MARIRRNTSTYVCISWFLWRGRLNAPVWALSTIPTFPVLLLLITIYSTVDIYSKYGTGFITVCQTMKILLLSSCMYHSFKARIGYNTSTYVCVTRFLWRVRFNAQLSAVWDRFHYRLPHVDIVHNNIYRYIPVETIWHVRGTRWPEA